MPLRKGWENAASPPWNLQVSVVFNPDEVEALVVSGFAAGEGIVLVEACLGSQSPNPQKILRRHFPSDSFVRMDDAGYVVFSDPEHTLRQWKRSRSSAKVLQAVRDANAWRDPFWEVRPDGAFVASFDHHGDRDGEPGALAQVYHRAFGCLHNHPNPRLVITSGIDEDLVGACVAALGALPHPQFFKKYYPEMRNEAALHLNRDMSGLVQLVDTVDTDINRVIELLDSGLGRSLLAWRESLRPEFRGSFLVGHACQRFVELFCLGRDLEAERLAVKKRKKRLDEITQVPQVSLGDGLVLVADLSGYDANSAFYEKLLTAHPFGVFVLGDWATGRGRITFAARSMEDAQRFLGPTGLRQFFKVIPGAGGHPNLGGAPWGGDYSFEAEGLEFGQLLVKTINRYAKSVPG